MSMTASQLALARQKIADQGTSEVQSILISNATGGTWTATFNGQTTTALSYNAGSNVLQNALAALSTIGLGNVQVNNNSPYVVSFLGNLQHAAQSMLTVNASGLTGTGIAIAILEVTQGGMTAFTDDELNANYNLALANFFLGLYYDALDLQFNASRFSDYTAGQTSEKKSQITANIEKMVEDYKVLSNASHQFLFASMVPEPPRVRAIPWVVGVPATSLTYAPPYGPRFRRSGWGGQ